MGFGAIEVGSERPDTVVVDRTLTDGLTPLITDALVSRSARSPSGVQRNRRPAYL